MNSDQTKRLSTRQLLTKIPNYPCLFRHSINGTYYGIKKHGGKRKEHSLDTNDRKLSHDFLAADSVFTIRWQASNYTLSEALKTARVWKHFQYGDFGVGEAQAEAFTKFGYGGTPIPLSVALPCKWSGKTLKGHPLAWTWLPHH